MTVSGRPRFNVCLFCGSNLGKNSHFQAAARDLGKRIADANFGMVYGGGAVGLMGMAADACLGKNGHVEGVIPDGLFEQEVAHSGLTQLFVVSGMHARKALMASRSDAFVALPGGFGTLEELFEVITWQQIGIHSKPVLLVNLEHYYSKLLDFIDHATDQGFIGVAHRHRIVAVDSINEVMSHLGIYAANSAPAYPEHFERS